MKEMPSAVTQVQFARWVRDVLKRLYDTPYLLSHPLAPLLLGQEARSATASQSLREVMLEVIQALRPGPGVPAQSPDWRAYRILELRYLEGLTRDEIMAELGVGKSQFFRDLRQILDLLAQRLWERYLATSREATQDAAVPVEDRPLVQTETDRLTASACWEPLALDQVLSELEPILQPLTSSQGIHVDWQAAQTTAVVRGDRVMVRQALLNLILYLVSCCYSGPVEVTCAGELDQVALRVRARLRDPQAQGEAQHERIDLCRQLMAAMAGQLQLRQEDGWLEAILRWPRAQSPVLLVVDDNQGLIDLYRRYLTGQNWQVFGARSGQEVWQTIEETRPAVILLDVMMPQEDGWEVLVSLKQRPATRDIPVLICSVVNEPELARSLGAAGNLPKPVAQKALLAMLSQWG